MILAVRADAPFERLEDTCGRRIGWTLPDVQSGYYALRYLLQQQRAGRPDPARLLYGEVVPRLVNPRGVIRALLDGRIEGGVRRPRGASSVGHCQLRLDQQLGGIHEGTAGKRRAGGVPARVGCNVGQQA